MPANQILPQKRTQGFDRVLEPSPHRPGPVRETTLYPSQFPILLRERMQGKTIAEAAECLGLVPEQFVRLLEGQWRPSKEICRRMRLKVVYAIANQTAALETEQFREPRAL